MRVLLLLVLFACSVACAPSPVGLLDAGPDDVPGLEVAADAAVAADAPPDAGPDAFEAPPPPDVAVAVDAAPEASTDAPTAPDARAAELVARLEGLVRRPPSRPPPSPRARSLSLLLTPRLLSLHRSFLFCFSFLHFIQIMFKISPGRGGKMAEFVSSKIIPIDLNIWRKGNPFKNTAISILINALIYVIHVLRVNFIRV
jgi:hypothetical protein